MQKAESNIGTEQRLDVCIREKKLRRCRTFSRGSIPGRRVLCVMNLHAAGREKELLSSLRSNQKFRRLG
jgi:hypothetical protein